MDFTPSSCRSFRQRLWSLFQFYSFLSDEVSDTSVDVDAGAPPSPPPSASPSHVVRRLDEGGFHASLNALTHRNSFRSIFLCSEDEMTIQMAIAKLQTTSTQLLLWKEMLQVDDYQMQLKLPNTEATSHGASKKAVGSLNCNDDFAEEDFLEAAWSAKQQGLDLVAQNESESGRRVSWIAYQAVLATFLFDRQGFYHSFLLKDIEAARALLPKLRAPTPKSDSRSSVRECRDEVVTTLATSPQAQPAASIQSELEVLMKANDVMQNADSAGVEAALQQSLSPPSFPKVETWSHTRRRPTIEIDVGPLSDAEEANNEDMGFATYSDSAFQDDTGSLVEPVQPFQLHDTLQEPVIVSSYHSGRESNCGETENDSEDVAVLQNRCSAPPCLISPAMLQQRRKPSRRRKVPGRLIVASSPSHKKLAEGVEVYPNRTATVGLSLAVPHWSSGQLLNTAQQSANGPPPKMVRCCSSSPPPRRPAGKPDQSNAVTTVAAQTVVKLKSRSQQQVNTDLGTAVTQKSTEKIPREKERQGKAGAPNRSGYCLVYTTRGRGSRAGRVTQRPKKAASVVAVTAASSEEEFTTTSQSLQTSPTPKSLSMSQPPPTTRHEDGFFVSDIENSRVTGGRGENVIGSHSSRAPHGNPSPSSASIRVDASPAWVAATEATIVKPASSPDSEPMQPPTQTSRRRNLPANHWLDVCYTEDETAGSMHPPPGPSRSSPPPIPAASARQGEANISAPSPTPTPDDSPKDEQLEGHEHHHPLLATIGVPVVLNSNYVSPMASSRHSRGSATEQLSSAAGKSLHPREEQHIRRPVSHGAAAAVAAEPRSSGLSSDNSFSPRQPPQRYNGVSTQGKQGHPAATAPVPHSTPPSNEVVNGGQSSPVYNPVASNSSATPVGQTPSPVSPSQFQSPQPSQSHVISSPPPRLSRRARVRSESQTMPQTPPRVPETRVLMSPSGSMQVTPGRSTVIPNRFSD